MNLRHPAPKAGALPAAPHLEILNCYIYCYSNVEQNTLSALLRCPKNLASIDAYFSTAAPKSHSLHLPPAALALFAQSRRATSCATSRSLFTLKHYNKIFGLCQVISSCFTYYNYSFIFLFLKLTLAKKCILS